ncbi:histidine phosphatase family protein [Enterococcus sp. BWR-S5]|nr:histidine phosphatase family protein [Enterococcus sp. BWR-S5]MBL1224608.1 histidine phosphatase family protein [Enterococcus sp. BWR-S5]
MKKTFYMMRHGQTLFNVRRKIQGACDSPLTEIGRQQAEIAGDFLKDIAFDHFYSSSAERACDTLEIVTQNKQPYTRLKGLKEMNFGAFEGESEDLNPENEKKSTFFLAYGGESREQVEKRLVATCREIMRQEDHHTVLAVSHSGACLYFLGAWQDPTPELEKGFPNCMILKYEYETEDESFRLLEIYRPVD